MVEAGQTALGAQIVEVLGDHTAAAAGEARDVVDGFRERVQEIAGNPPAEPPAQARLGGVVDGIPVRAVVDESSGVFDRAAILGCERRTRRRNVGDSLYVQARALGPQVAQFRHQRMRQSALHGEVPGLGVANPVVAVHRVGVGDLGGGGGRRGRATRETFLQAERARQTGDQVA